MIAAGPLHHVAVQAADPERVAAFYRDLLGLGEVARHAMSDGSGRVRSIWLRAGGTLLMIERAVPGSGPSTARHLLAFSIGAAEGPWWRARLQGGGHAVSEETASTLYCADPEGNRIGLSCYPDRLTPPGE